MLSARFHQFAQTTATWTGHPTAFLLAVMVIVVWIVSGPFFHYSDTWQLVINTGTTIVTFLMVFLIQNTQNRDIMAVQLKLSELVLAMKGAKNEFAAIEDLSDGELQRVHEQSRARVEMLTQHIEHRRARRRAGHRNGGSNKKRAAQRAKASRQSPQTSGK
ncbi:MAG: low affinity iron permease family protein [Rhizobiales bacterium]|nr:low affinity iron permease family protein [Hyphomicrobiales bacterium]